MMISRLWACCGIIVAFGGTALLAQDLEYASTSSALLERLDAAERKIAALQEQAQPVVPAETTVAAAGDVTYYYQPVSCGLYGGAEILFLKPFTSSFPFGSPNDYQPASRLWIGGQLAGGLGARFRWFEFNQNSPNPSPDNSLFFNPFFHDDLSIRNLDFEVTDAFQITDNWRALGSFGVRYTDFRLHLDLMPPIGPIPPADLLIHFAGTGPTAGLQLNRDLNWNGFSLFVGGQQSFLFGNQVGGAAASGGAVAATKQLLAISELQWGLQWSRLLGDGSSLLFVRTICEAQYYSPSEHFFAFGGDPNGALGLIGGGLTVGVSR